MSGGAFKVLSWFRLPVRLDGLQHPVGDLVDAVDLGQDAALGILGHHGFGLLVVKVQLVADDGFVVVAAAGFLGTAQETVPSSSSLAVSCRTMSSIRPPAARTASR